MTASHGPHAEIIRARNVPPSQEFRTKIDDPVWCPLKAAAEDKLKFIDLQKHLYLLNNPLLITTGEHHGYKYLSAVRRSTGTNTANILYIFCYIILYIGT